MDHAPSILPPSAMAAERSPAGSLVDLLLECARRRADQTAYSFFDPAKPHLETLTFGALLEEVKGLAVWLRERGAEAERCLLLLPPGLGYLKAFLACQLAGTIAVPAYFPDVSRLDRSLPRLLQMVRDSNARFALTTSSLSPLLQPLAIQRSALGLLSSSNLARKLIGLEQTERLSILSVPESSQASAAPRWKNPGVGPNTLSFLQYTSGSTHDPKGVVLTHGNLLANLEASCRVFGLDEGWRSVIWLPPYHDMGLIGGLLAAIYGGFRCDLMSPMTFLQRPISWLEAISRPGNGEKVVSGGPNFAFELCLRRVNVEQRKKLDLSRWEVAFCGAEPVRHETLECFAEMFEPTGFRYGSFLPCYGLAESTLIVSGRLVRDDPMHVFHVAQRSVEEGRAERAAPEDAGARALVSSGFPVPEHRVVIVNPGTGTERMEREVGEVWVSGPSVAQGYWRQREKTREVFEARIASGEGPFLRTGDLGFLDGEGRLFITGRIKDMVIVGGRKHYPHDIEATVQEVHGCLRTGGGTAFATQGASGESLVIVQEVSLDRLPEDRDALLRRIREEVVSAHDISPSAVVLVRERTIPKTSSGKLQRSATRALFESDKLKVVARWSAPRCLDSIREPLKELL
jgi:acyl-CoA synthetase (AMP-forming)/AMP-acid ligase II